MSLRSVFFGLVAMAVGLGVPSAAPAGTQMTIPGFRLDGIEGLVTECILDDRLGTAVGSTLHVINREDCRAYMGCVIRIMWSLQSTVNLPAGTQWKAVLSRSHDGECDPDTFEQTDTCLGLADYQNLTSAVGMSVIVEADDLMGVDCNAATDSTTRVTIVLDTSDGLRAQAIPFVVDLKPPKPPTLLDGSVADDHIIVEWNDDQNDAEPSVMHRVYWSDQPFAQSLEVGQRSDLWSSSPLMGERFMINDLGGGTPYWCAVAAIDENGNESDLTPVIRLTTSPASVGDDPKGGKSRGCAAGANAAPGIRPFMLVLLGCLAVRANRRRGGRFTRRS